MKISHRGRFRNFWFTSHSGPDRDGSKTTIYWQAHQYEVTDLEAKMIIGIILLGIFLWGIFFGLIVKG